MAIKKLYEATFIVNAALEDQDIDAVVSKVASYIENNGGTIKELQKWGRKRLAYPINKKYNGYYVHIIMEASPNVLPIFERFFVLDDTILRHLILQIENDLLELRANKALLEGRALAEAEALAKEEVIETAK
jgi:small subunit ribosomal protein S6